MPTPGLSSLKHILSLRRLAARLRQSSRKIAVIVLVILAIFALQKFLPLQAWMQSAAVAYRGLGAWGVVLFIVTYVILLLLFVPGPTLSLTAGALYGLRDGYLIAAVTSASAAAVAFVLARFLLRGRALRWVSRYPVFRAVESAGQDQPWRTAFSVHMSPLFPFPIANYMLALAGIRFSLYLFSVWLGMLPGILFYVYVGRLTGGLALGDIRLTMADGWAFGAARIALWIIGITATVSFGLLVKHHARRLGETLAGSPETPA